jgi:signal transduction histidine kinase
LRDLFPGEQFSMVIDWLSCMYAIYSLLSEISLGSGRIAEIVKALKTYTYMDQAPVQSVDVREGLDNTLIVLHSKLKRGVTVVREYAEDLPVIEAYASELNQVWTNLIDNAIDAMEGEGTLVVRARRDDPWVVVQIEDSGSGIPEEIQSKIFDPFFTTKGQGEGTGLGLNISRNLIVQKHFGEISVLSKPGSTCFTVQLPIDLKPPE